MPEWLPVNSAGIAHCFFDGTDISQCTVARRPHTRYVERRRCKVCIRLVFGEPVVEAAPVAMAAAPTPIVFPAVRASSRVGRVEEVVRRVEKGTFKVSDFSMLGGKVR